MISAHLCIFHARLYQRSIRAPNSMGLTVFLYGIVLLEDHARLYRPSKY